MASFIGGVKPTVTTTSTVRWRRWWIKVRVIRSGPVVAWRPIHRTTGTFLVQVSTSLRGRGWGNWERGQSCAWRVKFIPLCGGKMSALVYGLMHRVAEKPHPLSGSADMHVNCPLYVLIHYGSTLFRLEACWLRYQGWEHSPRVGRNRRGSSRTETGSRSKVRSCSPRVPLCRYTGKFTLPLGGPLVPRGIGVIQGMGHGVGDLQKVYDGHSSRGGRCCWYVGSRWVGVGWKGCSSVANGESVAYVSQC